MWKWLQRLLRPQYEYKAASMWERGGDNNNKQWITDQLNNGWEVYHILHTASSRWSGGIAVSHIILRRPK